MSMKACFGATLLMATGAGAGLSAEAIPVEIRQSGEGFQLFRGGQSYYVRGAGGNGSLEALASVGGNSVRTWGNNTVEYLDRAHAAGLSVCVGFWIEHERHGFDYNDDQAVAAEIRRHCQVIDQLKDHPAVLMWGIGNEVELQATNPRVYDVIQAIAAHAKKVDPHHPTMTVMAMAPEKDVQEVLHRCPSIDILGCNSYGGIKVLARQIRDSGWEKAYMVTEWGNDGSWEVKTTDWGAEDEPTSMEKARQFKSRYGLIQKDAGRCLGSYAFHWGNKQETTPTWFNLFLADGSRTEMVDTLQCLWTGSYPEMGAPQVTWLKLNNRNALSSVRVGPGQELRASYLIGNGSPNLRAVWELLPESTDKRLGGDAEARPGQVEISNQNQRGTCMTFQAPGKPGSYRLFFYLYGEGNSVATASFPFLVEK
jgi:hypothetical protein